VHRPRILDANQCKTVQIWDTTTRNAVTIPEGHTDWVRTIAFSRDGSRVVSSSDDKTARVWDTSTGNMVTILKGHTAYLTTVAFSPDGLRVVSGSDDRSVRVWDATTGDAVAILDGHTDWVKSVTFSPDGSRVVSISGDNRVKDWDVVTGDAGSQNLDNSSPQTKYTLDYASGWLLLSLPSSMRRICWLPFIRRPDERRDAILSSSGTVVIGSRTGILTILNCTSLPAYRPQ
jgi:WD40 repeat protein